MAVHQHGGGDIDRRRPWHDYFRELDFFPKVLDECQSSSSTGGLVALITFGFLAALVASEIVYVRGVDRLFQHGVDNDPAESPLNINIHIDVRTPCSSKRKVCAFL